MKSRTSAGRGSAGLRVVETSAGAGRRPDIERPIAGVPVRTTTDELLAFRRTDGTPVVLVPGLNGSGPGHWQSLWREESPAYRCVVQDDWSTPDLERWAERVDSVIRAHEKPVVLVAHSFGCLAAVHRAARNPGGIAAALLVAPANPDKFDVTWMLPARRLPFPATVVGSENDPWMPLISAGWWASRWGAKFVNAGAAGHINADSGHGAWPAGRQLLEELLRKAEAPGEFTVLAGGFPLAFAI